jgi:aspartate/methionine/tyrosine aminotransferase
MPRFSRRLAWHLEPNQLSILTGEKRAAGSPILDLTQSNPTDAGFNYPVAQIAAALADTRSLRYDPAAAGLAEARTAVAAYYDHRVPPNQILLTSSTSEAYSYLFKLLCDPGDQVLVPRPSYPLFEFLAALENVEVTQYPLRYQHGWSIDLGALRSLVGNRTRAVIIVNPNNPTGSYLDPMESEALTDLCRTHRLALIADEVFADYAFSAEEQRMPTLRASKEVLTFSLSGLSKVSGLPQMKLGWIVVNGPGDQVREAYDRLELIADTFLSVSAPVQYAAPALLRVARTIQPQIRERTEMNLALLRDRTHDTALRTLEVQGGWYATVQVPRIRSEEEWVLELLREYNVLVQPGFFYDFEAEAFLILSLLTSEEVFAEGVDRLLALANRP